MKKQILILIFTLLTIMGIKYNINNYKFIHHTHKIVNTTPEITEKKNNNNI